MKALSYNPNSKENSFLNLVDIAKPRLNNNNAIIKVLGVGVCGSDLLKLNRGLVLEGVILGHEMVGVIEEINEELSAKYSLAKGDRIISSHHVPCLKCNYCLDGQESLCEEFKTSNFNPGAFCEYLELSERHLKYTVQKIPDHLNNEEASFTEPVACCIKAIRKSKSPYKHKQRNLVLGLGSIGLIIGQLLKHYYPNDLIVGSDLISSRLELAQRLGFDQVAQSIEGEFDCIFLCAGANASLDTAIKHASNGAVIVVFASVNDSSKGFANNDIYYKELTIMGSYSPNLCDLEESLQTLSRKGIQVKPLITHTASLDNLGEVLQRYKQEQGIKVYLDLE